MVVLLGLLSIVLNTVSQGEILYTKRVAWLVLGTIGLNAFTVYRALESTRTVLKHDKVSLKSLFTAKVGEGTPILNVVFMLSLIGLYAVFAYPYFPRVFGGGKKPLVQIVLSDRAQVRWKDLGVAVSEDEKTIGPVVLLLETDSMFMVANPEERQVEKWFPVGKRGPAIGVDKKMVSALVYRERPK